MRLFVFILASCLSFSAVAAGVIVPERLKWAGMTLKFTAETRKQVQGYVDQYQRNYVYFQTLADRAATYMPFIEDAFLLMGAPEDLKYIAIQESALQADAVSTSQAVGFWQFKAATAKAMGLRVDWDVDERMHIFRASIGAAKYFRQNYGRYQNWVYAVTAYYAGGTGAKPFTESQYYGKDVMVVDKHVHWYALKAIAHKLAYEKAVEEVQSPKLKLYPFSNQGELSVRKLAEAKKVSVEEFKVHNKWIKKEKLPADRPYSYYVPLNKPGQFALADPHRALYAPSAPVPASAPAVAVSTKSTPPEKTSGKPPEKAPVFSPKTEPQALPMGVVAHPVTKDPYYGNELVRAQADDTPAKLAARYSVPLKKLLRWNSFAPADPVPEGTLVVLVPPRKAHVHIARKWESLNDVATKYNRNAWKLTGLNRLHDPAELLLEGQKIYLQEQRGREEPIVVYRFDDGPTSVGPKVLTEPRWVPKPSPRAVVGKPISPEKLGTASGNPSEGAPPDPVVVAVPNAAETAQYHTVQAGETLWRIALLYKTPLDELRRLNSLNGSELQAGQKLRVK